MASSRNSAAHKRGWSATLKTLGSIIDIINDMRMRAGEHLTTACSVLVIKDQHSGNCTHTCAGVFSGSTVSGHALSHINPESNSTDQLFELFGL